MVESQTTTGRRTMLEEALDAFAAGLCVIPPMEDGSKRPISAWQMFQVQRPGRKRVERWYQESDRHGLGLICGAVSGNLELLEFDDLIVYTTFHDTAEAIDLDVVRRIEAGYLEQTPGGGMHLLYRCAEISGNMKLARSPEKALIETRGEGGYVVLAPSHGGVHPTGNPYVRLSGSFATIVEITPDERDQLHRLSRSFDRIPRVPDPAPTEPASTDEAGTRPGDLFNAQATWEAILEPHGWKLLYTRNGESYWRRPGKDRDWSATTNVHGSDLLWMFTSSTVFEPDHSYSKFGAYAVLNFGGDYKAAARALAKQGYKVVGKGFTVNGASPNGKTLHVATAAAPLGSLDLADFASYLPEHKYIYRPTGKIWELAGVNSAFPPIGSGKDAIKQSTLIDERCPIHDMTWAPGHPEIIADAFLAQGGWLPRQGARVFNTYRPPVVAAGDPAKANRWVEHVERVYPDEAERIVLWLAHRVQRPDEKLNHALVLGGAQGIGKDTILEPVKRAVGPWNFGDISPIELLGRFNAFLKSVVVRVSELRDLGDRDRYGFYEHTKTVIAAPPDTVLIDEKNIRAYRVPNLVGVVFTTNHRTDGLYLPADDRRHYVAWSDLTSADVPDGYWTDLYRWFDDDGDGGSGAAHVAALLATLDLAGFDPKAPPPKTPAFWDIVAASRAPEDADLSDAIDKLGDPDAVTISDILSEQSVDLDFKAFLRDRKNSRQMPHRFEAAGYVATQNPGAQSGLWVVAGRRQVVYAKRDLSIRDRISAARHRTERGW